jgi:hypothetical protein
MPGCCEDKARRRRVTDPWYKEPVSRRLAYGVFCFSRPTNAIYLELVAAAAASEAHADQLRTIANNMMARERLDAIVLAGTELALIGDWRELQPRILSAADLHVAEIVRRAVAAGP